MLLQISVIPARGRLGSLFQFRHGTRRTRATARLAVRRRQLFQRLDHQLPQHGAVAARLIVTETTEMQRKPDGSRGQQGDDVPRVGLPHFVAVTTKELRDGILTSLVAPHQLGTGSQDREPDIEIPARHVILLPDTPGHLPGNSDAEPIQPLPPAIRLATDDHASRH